MLSRAKQTSVIAIAATGLLKSGAGKVRLLRPSEISVEWNPRSAQDASVWEALHRMVAALPKGNHAAGQILVDVTSKSDGIRQLAYRLYTLCERRGWASDARVYDDIVRAWTYIERKARIISEPEQQLDLKEGE